MRIHSILSPKCRVGPSAINGQGVFAAAPFAPGEMVAVWGGKVCSTLEVAQIAKAFPHIETHGVSIYEGYHLVSDNLFELDDAELMNHSCEPNVGVRGQVIVVARRAIVAGEELAFDYETIETSMVPFDCRCGSSSCRGKIDGGGYRNPAFVAKNREYMSLYILDLLGKHLNAR